MSRTPSKRRISVCLVTQNCLAEAYLRQTLCKLPAIRVASLEQFMRLTPLERRGTVFVVDACELGMPLRECFFQLRSHCSDAKFLVLAPEKSTELIVQLLVMGAHGYLPSAKASGTLARAVFSVAANQFWVPSEAIHEFLRQAASALRKDPRAADKISPREAEILELVRRRLSNREIAHLLRIRVSTVKFHVSNILSKRQARNRRDLIDAASNPLRRLLAQ